MSAAEDTSRRFLEAPVLWQSTPTARIAYRRFGSGPPIVFVHGWPMCGFTFRKLVPYLQDRFTLYLLDAPGGGDTEWGANTDFTWPGQAMSLRAFVEGVGLDRYVLFGQDSGAMIARHLALIHGPRVRGLLMTNTEIPHHRPPFMRLFRALMFVPGTNPIFRLLLRSRRFAQTPMGFGGGFEDRRLIQGDFYEHIIAPLVRSARRMEGHNRFLRGWSWSRLDEMATVHREITAPVRLVWGVQDETFPLQRAREMSSQFSDFRGILEVDRARLFVHEEQPELVAAEVIRFVDAL